MQKKKPFRVWFLGPESRKIGYLDPLVLFNQGTEEPGSSGLLHLNSAPDRHSELFLDPLTQGLLFELFQGGSRSVQVLFNGIEAVLKVTLKILN